MFYNLKKKCQSKNIRNGHIAQPAAGRRLKISKVWVRIPLWLLNDASAKSNDTNNPYIRWNERIRFLVIDYSQEHDLLYVCAMNNGEIWTLNNKTIRIQNNISLNRINNTGAQPSGFRHFIWDEDDARSIRVAPTQVG